MKIGGYQKRSLTDFPGKVAAVVYTQGCDWRCPFCHVRSLVIPARFQPRIPEEDVFRALEYQHGETQAVVVTGGEPTLQYGLAPFLRRVRSLGFATKLDTNGSRPAVLAALFNEGLLDYVTMDVKGPIASYARFAGHSIDTGKIELSIELIRSSGVEYELRTTLVGGLHTPADIRAMAPLLFGAKRYAVQTYRCPPASTRTVNEFTPPGAELFHEAGECLRSHVDEFLVR
jgi:pyruvate formate lyase activating enzyme